MCLSFRRCSRLPAVVDGTRQVSLVASVQQVVVFLEAAWELFVRMPTWSKLVFSSLVQIFCLEKCFKIEFWFYKFFKLRLASFYFRLNNWRAFKEQVTWVEEVVNLFLAFVRQLIISLVLINFTRLFNIFSWIFWVPGLSLLISFIYSWCRI